MNGWRAAARGTVLAQATRLVSRVARDADAVTRARSAADLVIAAILADDECAELADPPGFVGFLRDAFEPQRHDVRTVVPARGTIGAEQDLRFSTLLRRLADGVPALSRREATRVGLIADGLMDRRDPFVRPHWVADVGFHAEAASSFGRKGRLLAVLVRCMRPGRVLEIGTGYGMSALFLARELERQGGRLVTLERSDPQADVAREILGREHARSVEVRRAIGVQVADDFEPGSFGFLFHDGEHSERAYVEDFERSLPSLQDGAVVLFDDIRWDDPHSTTPTNAYRGWERVARHPRVSRAVEVDGLYGLLLLT